MVEEHLPEWVGKTSVAPCHLALVAPVSVEKAGVVVDAVVGAATDVAVAATGAAVVAADVVADAGVACWVPDY